MLVIPINHGLSKQELIDIYQGVMPESSLKANKKTVETTVFPSHVIADAPPGVLSPTPGHNFPPWIPAANNTAVEGNQKLFYPLTNYGLHWRFNHHLHQ